MIKFFLIVLVFNLFALFTFLTIEEYLPVSDRVKMFIQNLLFCGLMVDIFCFVAVLILIA